MEASGGTSTADLAPLDVANFRLPLRYREHGRLRRLPQLLDVIHVAVADHPRDPLRDGGLGHAAESGSGERFHDKCAWPRTAGRMG